MNTCTVIRLCLCLLLSALQVGMTEAAELSAQTLSFQDETRRAIFKELADSGSDSLLLPEQVAPSSFSATSRKLLDAMSGPAHYDPAKARLGLGLTRSAEPTSLITLREVVLTAIENNLDGRMARLLPALRGADVMEAEGAFDWEAFASSAYRRVNKPKPAEAVGGTPISGDTTEQNTVEERLGMRKKVLTGATIEASTGLSYLRDSSRMMEYIPNPAYSADATLTITQPLLRNAGPTVTGFRIDFARTAQDRDRFQAEQTLSQVALAAETAYWELAVALQRLLIAQELLDRTAETCRSLEARAGIDVKPVQMAQAKSFLLSRTDELQRAQTSVRSAGDKLRELINSPAISLLAETVPLPADRPTVTEGNFSLSAAVTTSLGRNPELRQALLEVENARLEAEVNRIQTLPQLNLKLEGGLYGMGSDYGKAYKNWDRSAHYGGSALLELAWPLENRTARAAFDRAELTLRDRKLNYRKKVLAVTGKIKESLRKVQMTSALSDVSREARYAAAENLRVLQEREKDVESLTPEFLLDLKLNAQQRLAEAELREYQNLAEFRTALAGYAHACGTLLERYAIAADASR